MTSRETQEYHAQKDSSTFSIHAPQRVFKNRSTTITIYTCQLHFLEEKVSQ